MPRPKNVRALAGFLAYAFGQNEVEPKEFYPLLSFRLSEVACDLGVCNAYTGRKLCPERLHL